MNQRNPETSRLFSDIIHINFTPFFETRRGKGTFIDNAVTRNEKSHGIQQG